ncbi:MAG TPA: hypothetical protein VGH54_29640 [Mycobacterium sp.]|jgi:hypothetical protein|uniref:hypothetical protein n=1 Tax=Mycobacterium sp. TaxID=1785 RepID=UPI002F3E98B4
MKVLTVPSSGSQAGTTASHNRFGQYTRNRRTPTNPRTARQGVVRAALSAASAAWRAITDAQRDGWKSLGLMMTRTDSLGSTYTLQPNQAFVSVNAANNAAGNTSVSDAPALVTPTALATVTLTLTAVAFSIAYTATPLPTGARLFVYASPQKSAGRSFANDLRLIFVSAAAAASPANVLAAYTAKFGVPVSGNRIFLTLVVYQTGFLSGPFYISQVVA